MTCVPELILAREIGLPYATVALSTDYDCWNDEEEHVNFMVLTGVILAFLSGDCGFGCSTFKRER